MDTATETTVRRQRAREMTPAETAEALKHVLSLRRKPVTIVLEGCCLGEGLSDLVADTETSAIKVDASDGESDRYERFRRRWGLKFRRSIIARSLIAWQMHVCRLPVFPRENVVRGRRASPRRLLQTRDSKSVVGWFRHLDSRQRWELCESCRNERSERRAQRQREKSLASVVS